MNYFSQDYLGLLKMVLTRYGLEPAVRFSTFKFSRSEFRNPIKYFIAKHTQRIVESAGQLVFSRPERFDFAKRLSGLDWPIEAETMIGVKRLDQFHKALITCDVEQIKGDVLEAGVWRGGAVIFAAAYLSQTNPLSRRVIAADSFDGLPPPDSRYPVDTGDLHSTVDFLRVSLEEVRENFKKFGVSTENVDFLPGWFEDTLPTLGNRRLAILRMDGDMYSSSIHILSALFDQVTPGGFVIVDDYQLRGARVAVHDFLDERGLSPEIINIDGMGAYFRV
jgi:O-methyltransferase